MKEAKFELVLLQEAFEFGFRKLPSLLEDALIQRSKQLEPLNHWLYPNAKYHRFIKIEINKTNLYLHRLFPTNGETKFED